MYAIRSYYAKPVAASAPAARFLLDAGSYLVAASRDAIEAKIRAFGYEPEVDPA